MKASEALLLSMGSIDKKELKGILDHIKDAAESGKTSIIIPYRISDILTKGLEALGYEIRGGFEGVSNPAETKVSWLNATS